jgi:chromosome segregation protein
MHLRRLELQGFKTFAQKTVLEFVPMTAQRRGMTGIVGPNGSGKSNVADAIRWVMGEQSLKLLRSKKSEDVIFSGTEKRSRSGFAEVTMTLVNDDEQSEIDLPEVVITRRLYRDGQSEYEVNKKSSRLTDVALLLAQCGIGQRTYSVIGQGMVDAVLSASPSERKEFFDEAAGLRVFQLKRTQAINKLDATHENVKQAEVLLREIEPRLVTLERQVKRLREREGIEEELRRVERLYFGRVWSDLKQRLEIAMGQHASAEAAFANKNQEAVELERELAGMEQAKPVSSEVNDIRAVLDVLREERVTLREQQIRLDARKQVAAVRAEKPWSPLPLSKIIEEIDAMGKAHDELMVLLDAKKLDVEKIREVAKKLVGKNTDLLGRLQRPAPEPEAPKSSTDPAVDAEVQKLADAMDAIAEKIRTTESRLQELNRKEESSRSHLFETQRRLTSLRHEAQSAERRLSETSVEVARIETRRESFFMELRNQAPALETELNVLVVEVAKDASGDPVEKLQGRMQRLRSQLEWIGGIDPATVKEYEDTQARFTTLSAQVTDLRQAVESLETIIAELDQTIKTRGDIAFKKLNDEFGSYFKKLFGGGEARLIQLEAEPVLDEEGNVLEEVDENAGPAGIEMQATPPGKRLKSIALLSGGERALTSIALIGAIMATNPSPFVVLDEVDAALDESNSKKFADILDSLAEKTQFVVITHNRATMGTAHVLYGVTMAEDGSSQILSVKLDA